MVVRKKLSREEHNVQLILQLCLEIHPMFILFNLLMNQRDVRERLITTESGEPKERARDQIINWQAFVKYCKKLKMKIIVKINEWEIKLL